MTAEKMTHRIDLTTDEFATTTLTKFETHD